MRRRSPGEIVEPFRRREHGPEGQRLREMLSAWARQVEGIVTGAWPEMPTGINDRDADVWEALLGVADAAGGDWPERARVAAVTLVTDSKRGTPSLGIKLLADLREVFRDEENLTTERILSDLHKMDESPWGDLKGKALDPRGLSQRLRPYDIKPTTIRTFAGTSKGYRREDMHDAWLRYLGPNVTDKEDKHLHSSRGSGEAQADVGVPPHESVTSVTSGTPEPQSRQDVVIEPKRNWFTQGAEDMARAAARAGGER